MSKMHICAKCDSSKYFKIKFPTETKKKSENRKKNEWIHPIKFIMHTLQFGVKWKNMFAVWKIFGIKPLNMSQPKMYTLKWKAIKSQMKLYVQAAQVDKECERKRLTNTRSQWARRGGETERKRENPVPFWNLFYGRVHRLMAPAEVLN